MAQRNRRLRMQEHKIPATADPYFKDFSAYLRSGDSACLNRVFPQAPDLKVAAVYRNGFLRSCVDALRASYPVVELLVGEDYFGKLAVGYIEMHPPRRSTFVGYGERFPLYLENRLNAHQLPYLSDFAVLDRAWIAAYFAQDSRLLDEEQLERWQQGGNDISEICCELPASAALLTLNYDISSLWLKLKSGSKPSNITRLNPVAQRLLIWRDKMDQINIRVLNTAEFSFLASLRGGSSLITAATSAIEQQSDFPVLGFFSELLDADVLASNQLL